MSEQGIDPRTYFESENEHPFMAEFRKLWSNNGNELSIQYSGTGIDTLLI
jgi:hypothetical protein